MLGAEFPNTFCELTRLRNILSLEKHLCRLNTSLFHFCFLLRILRGENVKGILSKNAPLLKGGTSKKLPLKQSKYEV